MQCDKKKNFFLRWQVCVWYWLQVCEIIEMLFAEEFETFVFNQLRRHRFLRLLFFNFHRNPLSIISEWVWSRVYMVYFLFPEVAQACVDFSRWDFNHDLLGASGFKASGSGLDLRQSWVCRIELDWKSLSAFVLAVLGRWITMAVVICFIKLKNWELKFRDRIVPLWKYVFLPVAIVIQRS